MQDRQNGPTGAQASLASAAPGIIDDIALARLRLQRIAERAQVRTVVSLVSMLAFYSESNH